ncbi:hypothetical protein BN1723_009532 [Verticillium longisporum]|uniref:assimilatory sulfite reductase (NADPH) n=1 Tax=Verticillium longisporum TaxID=100787 RepID=A0A0G4KPY8_VERLO|nr:hypothetical protein BN1723_009532 [Verticillium longisporum]
MATITELDAHEQPSEEMRASWKSYSKLEAFHLRNHPDIDDPRSEAQAKDYKVAGVIAAEKVASAFASVHPEPIDPSTIRDVPILYHPLLPGLLIVPDLVPPAVQKSLISLMEAFLKAIPASTQRIAVLGQVRDELAVNDATVLSTLYTDVLTSIAFSGKFHQDPVVSDVKYAASEPLTPQSVADIFGKVSGHGAAAKRFPSLVHAKQYTFWDLDSSAAANSPFVIGNLLSRESTSNVYVSEQYDNLVQGGVVRTDIRSSKKTIDAPYAIEDADVVAVGEEKLLRDIDILQGVKEGGKLLVKLPKFKDEDVEKRIPAFVRKSVREKGAEIYILDPAQSAAFDEDELAASILFEFAFLEVAHADISREDVARSLLPEGSSPSLQEILDALDVTLRKFDLPSETTELPADHIWPSLPATIKTNSFAPAKDLVADEVSRLVDWQAAAKGLAFKEAYGTKATLRPELSVKTHTVTVKENRRLTPETYDRNIFHIEFDLGDSGVTYKIGEALGIHAENDDEEVQAFIKWYGINPDEIVQVPSREDAAALDTRTVYQALKQNIDVLGKPPKRFYEALAEFTSDEKEAQQLRVLGGAEGAVDFKKRSEEDTLTYVDVLQEFPSARPSFHDLLVYANSTLQDLHHQLDDSRRFLDSMIKLKVKSPGPEEKKKQATSTSETIMRMLNRLENACGRILREQELLANEMESRAPDEKWKNMLDTVMTMASVLQVEGKEAIAYEGKLTGKKVNPRNEIEKLKDEGRYVLEVY